MQDKKQKPIAQNVLAFTLDQTLRLLHPFIPFITEGIFQNLNKIAPTRKIADLANAENSDALVAARWPDQLEHLTDDNIEKQVELVQSIIRTIRDIRSNRNIPPKKQLTVSVKSQQQTVDILNNNAALIEQLAGVKGFKAGTAITKPQTAAIGITDAAEVYVHDAIDTKAERNRLKKQKEQIEKAGKSLKEKLKNKNFINKARPQVVQQAKERLEQLNEQLQTIDKHLSELDT